MTDPVTPTAPVAPVTPVAPETPPAAPAVTTPAMKPTEEPKSILDAADPSAPPATPPVTPEAKWYLSEGVPGKGEPPEWFKADKYKTVDEQAKAYIEAEKRFGGFTGAPKDGVYKINPPEGIAIEFEQEHPLFKKMTDWAKESQFSQKAFDQMIGMLAEYEAGLYPDMAQIKASLGENADARLNAINKWAAANFNADELKRFKSVQTGQNAAEVFSVFEAVVAKTRAPVAPPVDDTVVPAGADEAAEIEKMHNAKNEKGQRLIDVDPVHRQKVWERRKAFADYQAKKS